MAKIKDSISDRFIINSNDLPLGVYAVNLEGKFLYYNKRTAEILELPEHPEDFSDYSIVSFYKYPEDRAKLQEDTKRSMETGTWLERRGLEFIVGGKVKFVSDYCGTIRDPEAKSVIGYSGYLVDFTNEELYRRMLEDVPVGFYVVEKENGKEVIRDCNRQFREMFEFDKSGEDPIGFEIWKLHQSKQEYGEFRKKLESIHDNAILGRIFNANTRTGKSIQTVINFRIRKDIHQGEIGRIGVMRDITKEDILRKQMQELAMDIGRVLHGYSSMLLSLQYIIDPIIKSYAPDPFAGGESHSVDFVNDTLDKPSKHLASAIKKMLPYREKPVFQEILTKNDWNKLEDLARQLEKSRDDIPLDKLRPSTLREMAQCTLEICNRIKRGMIQREILKQAKLRASDLIRICLLQALYESKSTIFQMEHEIRSLRGYVTSGVRDEEPLTSCNIKELLNTSVTHLEEFAKDRQVELKIDIRNPNLRIEGIERDLIRAFENLLHNAIKYSWKRKDIGLPWVQVSQSYNRDDELIYISVVNWGVAIPWDEIVNDLIFQPCYRGRLSSDRGRKGTGLGLTHAREIIQSHGGEITVESRPAKYGSDPRDYTKPFITTFTISLPRIHQRENRL